MDPSLVDAVQELAAIGIALAVVAFTFLLFSRRKTVTVSSQAPPPKNAGILAAQVYFPEAFVDQSELDLYSGASSKNDGVGQEAVAFTGDCEDTNSMALSAVQLLLDTFQISPLQVDKLKC